ncbi:aminoacyl-tRNA deacylase [Williamsia herbipolensis]|uniref:aminoacyl-tRNA deacylase n=1 Tax=Williamsia herbipolensis TaxID=1603258 RepID=UPI0005F77913|nr:aminoacyl-tRNA deacylase [Williamsia herbipolensis]
MSAMTPAVAAARRAGVEHRIHRYRADPRARSYGDDAVEHLADTLGVDAAQIFKTLVLSLSGGGDAAGSRARFAVAVLPVPRRLSPRAVVAALSDPSVTRAALAEPAAAQRVTGYVLGGVSPLGQRTALPTVIDASALAWPTILCSAGRRGLEIELAPADLRRLTDAVVADICS